MGQKWAVQLGNRLITPCSRFDQEKTVSRTILIVDDDWSQREYLEAVITGLGCRAHTLSGGAGQSSFCADRVVTA
jgi:hypothetical protein